MRRAVPFIPQHFEEDVDPRNHRYMRIRVEQDHHCLGLFLRYRTDGIGAQQWHTLFRHQRIAGSSPAGVADNQ